MEVEEQNYSNDLKIQNRLKKLKKSLKNCAFLSIQFLKGLDNSEFLNLRKNNLNDSFLQTIQSYAKNFNKLNYLLCSGFCLHQI